MERTVAVGMATSVQRQRGWEGGGSIQSEALGAGCSTIGLGFGPRLPREGIAAGSDERT